MSFFSQFPRIDYDFNRTGTIQQMVNIFRSVRARSTIFDDILLYKEYTIKDGMRPDILSNQLYNTPDYYWTFFIINDFLHDGLQTWPMSQRELDQYLINNYSGVALTFTPELNLEGETINSIAGKLEIGGLVYGLTTGAVGRIVRKDIDLNLIVLQDVIAGVPGRNTITGQVDTTVKGGSFGDSSTIVGGEGEFISSSWRNKSGDIQSLTTGDASTGNTDFLRISKAEPYVDSPAYFYIDGDPEERPVTSQLSIPQNTILKNRVYSEVIWNTDLQKQILEPSYSGNQRQFLNDSTRSSHIATNTSPSEPLIYAGGFITSSDDKAGGVVAKSNRAYIIDRNEKRSSIMVINPIYMVDFVEEFEALINV